MMSAFEEHAHAWRSAAFPRGSAVDALDEIHADLALYDACVAESVVPFLDRGVWEPAAIDVLGALDELSLRIASLQAVGTDDSEAASSYATYADMLREMYRVFLQERQSP